MGEGGGAVDLRGCSGVSMRLIRSALASSNESCLPLCGVEESLNDPVLRDLVSLDLSAPSVTSAVSEREVGVVVGVAAVGEVCC